MEEGLVVVAEVVLDPGSYRGTYKLVAGAPALDFANLVSYRGTDREHDWLEPETNVERWQAAAGIPGEVATDVAEVRGFREVAARVFLAVADGELPAADDLDAIGARAAAAWERRRLRWSPSERCATWLDPAPMLVATIALDAASLLTDGTALERVAACDGCRWLFLDTTRNHSRRWCDAADCGNRTRQRRHYHRHRAR